MSPSARSRRGGASTASLTLVLWPTAATASSQRRVGVRAHDEFQSVSGSRRAVCSGGTFAPSGLPTRGRKSADISSIGKKVRDAPGATLRTWHLAALIGPVAARCRGQRARDGHARNLFTLRVGTAERWHRFIMRGTRQRWSLPASRPSNATPSESVNVMSLPPLQCAPWVAPSLRCPTADICSRRRDTRRPWVQFWMVCSSHSVGISRPRPFALTNSYTRPATAWN